MMALPDTFRSAIRPIGERLTRCAGGLGVLALVLLVLLTACGPPPPSAAEAEFEIPPGMIVYPIEPGPGSRPGPLRVSGLDDNAALRESIEETAFRSRKALRTKSRFDWDGTALIVWLDTEAEFFERTRFAPEHTPAAATPSRQTIWINGDAWRRAPSSQRQQVMTHEMGHLLLGRLGGGNSGLPLWVEEGIVQHLAGETTLERYYAAIRASFLRRLPSLADLEREFPRDGTLRNEAYAISHQAVLALMDELQVPAGEWDQLLVRLFHPETGTELREQLYDPRLRGRVEVALGSRMGNRATQAIVLFGSSTALWGVATVLLVWAVLKKRRRRKLAAALELEDEPWLSSLDDKDLEEIWGRRDD